uniref:C2H2-type domain-containing protein n=1 Tax=Neogobius melanostomus TaxID=47308 RepID=A0A8C6TRV1_9GOBI
MSEMDFDWRPADQRTPKRAALKKDSKRGRAARNSVTNGGKKRDAKQARCSICGKSYKKNYKTHLSVHTAEKPLSCSFCNKRFRQKYNLKEHMKIHTDEKPFSCPDCGVRFRHQHNLCRHISTVHKGQKPYSCPMCEKAFSQKRRSRISCLEETTVIESKG